MRNFKSLWPLVIAVTTFSCTPKYVPPKRYLETPSVEKRAQLEGTIAYANNLETLVGRILNVKKKDGTCPDGNVFSAITMSLKQYIKPDAKITVVSDKSIVYEGRKMLNGNIDTTFPFVAAQGAGVSAVEYIVTDISRVNGTGALDIDDSVDLVQNWLIFSKMVIITYCFYYVPILQNSQNRSKSTES